MLMMEKPELKSAKTFMFLNLLPGICLLDFFSVFSVPSVVKISN